MIPVTTIDGQPSSLAAFAGRVLLVVNVASKCGYTPQYEGLEKLYERFRGRGFEVLGFPANDFGGQEPGTNEEIASFCSLTFGVSFPMFEKVVATGAHKHPLYAALIAAKPQAVTRGDKLRRELESFAASHSLPAPTQPPEVLWNFEKFLINRSGEVVARFGTDVSPEDPDLVNAIENALA